MALSKRQLLLLLGTAFAILSTEIFSSKVLSAQAKVGVDGIQQINTLEAIILGLIQGATEFLPISSTGLVKVVPVVIGWGDPGLAFSAVIQLGSIAAVIWYFWQDLRRTIKGAIRAIQLKDYDDYDFRLWAGIVLGTLPILFFGFLIKTLIPDYTHSPLRSLQAIAIASIIMSMLLALAEKLGKRQREFEAIGLTDGLLIGIAQSIALIPGVSRSSSTLTAGLFLGLERETAARFSFLLGIPAITIAGFVELEDALQQGLGDTGIFALVSGVISAALFSYLAIAGLLRFLKTESTWVFIWYRLLFGVIILAAIASGLLKNS